MELSDEERKEIKEIKIKFQEGEKDVAFSFLKGELSDSGDESVGIHGQKGNWSFYFTKGLFDFEDMKFLKFCINQIFKDNCNGIFKDDSDLDNERLAEQEMYDDWKREQEENGE